MNDKGSYEKGVYGGNESGRQVDLSGGDRLCGSPGWRSGEDRPKEQKKEVL